MKSQRMEIYTAVVPLSATMSSATGMRGVGVVLTSTADIGRYNDVDHTSDAAFLGYRDGTPSQLLARKPE